MLSRLRAVGRSLWLYEAALLALGLGTGIALLARAGPARHVMLEVAAATLLYAGCVRALQECRSPIQKIRMAVGFGYVLWFYEAVAQITPALGTGLRDAELYAADTALFGTTPAVCWQAVARPWLTELMSAGYLSYHVYLFSALGWAFYQLPEQGRRLANRLFTAFAVGLAGYLLVPAVGPARGFPYLFAAPLEGGPLTEANRLLVVHGSSVYDVFPSLHLLVTCLLLDYDRQAHRWRFRVMLGPAAVLTLSTLYLRYHYAVDLVAALALFPVLRKVGHGLRWWGSDGSLLEGTGQGGRDASSARVAPMTDTLPPWVAGAAQLPLAFAQVREDALLDLWVAEQGGSGVGVLMVASGGCTAAALAASGRVARLHLVDPNPAQMALARLKVALVATADPALRLRLLGHGPLAPAERAARLSEELAALGLTPEALGPPAVWAEVGPDHAGRYERVFAALREVLRPGRDGVHDLLLLRDPDTQAALAAPDTPLGKALDAALDSVMALPNLVALFGAQATRNRVELFARHFARRTRWALASLPAADNPYLWQMYSGRFPAGVSYPWFDLPRPSALPELMWSVTDMVTALRAVREPYDFVHLSNILDWLSPEEARVTLDLAAAALRPGGVVLVRQLNSTLDVAATGPAFAWDAEAAAALHARDRSFFYRALHLGRKR